MSGVNFRNKDSLRSNTIKGYATGINSLFALRGMEAPIVLSDPNNMAGILINNLIKEEDIAKQRSPLDSKLYAELLRRSNVSCSPDSEHHTVSESRRYSLHSVIFSHLNASFEKQFHNATTHFFTPKSMTMASAGAIRGKYLPNNGDGGVQWQLGQP